MTKFKYMTLLVSLLSIGCQYALGEDKTSDEVVDKGEPQWESYPFQAEVSRMMDIIINSLYTQKEVFLRELISNSADALEKIRYLSVSDGEVLGEGRDLDIRIEFDKDAQTLSLTDTGIGMSKQELINNLGTLAKSGTTNFLEAISSGTDISLIGQFGVGFYSTYLVADKVTVYSKKNDNDQYVWSSTADGKFVISLDPEGPTRVRGTKVVLHLKDDSTNFLSENTLKELTKKFSQFISYPIYLKVEKSVSKEVEDDDVPEDTPEETPEDDTPEDEKKEKKKKMKTVTEKVTEWEQMNTQKAIWLRSKEGITQEEYTEFYKSISKEWTAPLTQTHFSAEGEVDFKAILFCPASAPQDMFDNYYNKKAMIKLFVRRVLVSEEIDDLLPNWLHFIKGVVDSDDLPLNVSREQLQQHKILKVISKKLIKKVLDMFRQLQKESADEEKEITETTEETPEGEEKKEKTGKTKFDTFYKEFGKNLKLGCYEDEANRAKIVKLLRFTTSVSGSRQVGLSEYVERMQPDQDVIYYMSGDSVEKLKTAPHLQMFKKKNVEVVFLTEQMDEPCVQRLTDYEGKKFVSIQKGNVNLGETDDDKKRWKKLKAMYEPLTKWFKDILADKIFKVDLSKRLVSDPCTVVSSEYGYSAQMEKIMKAQSFGDQTQLQFMTMNKIFELNPSHPIVKDLLKKVSNDANDETAKTTGLLLFESSMIAAGFELQNPVDISNAVYKLLSSTLGVDPSEEVTEVDVGPLETETETDDENTEDEDEDEEDNEDMSGKLDELMNQYPTDATQGEEETAGDKDEL
eukprot:GHVR01062231.1.p1 GENE.GHVR01062231.1~~GHVR01062231.1.p1  ORF type:complete len:799 (-),score=205.03 GHVR01062231.1:287-2683(-)